MADPREGMPGDACRSGHIVAGSSGYSPQSTRFDMAELGNFLRVRQMRVSVEQILAAQQLLLALANSGKLQEPGFDLALHLRPVFCSSVEDQLRFAELFAQWLPQATEPVVKPDEVVPKVRRSTDSVVAIALLCVLLVCPLVAVLLPPPPPPPGVVVTPPPQGDEDKGGSTPLPNTKTPLNLNLSHTFSTPPPEPANNWLWVWSLLPAFASLALWWWLRRAPVLKRERMPTPEKLIEFQLPGGVRQLLPQYQLRAAGSGLRPRIRVASRELDIDRSLSASIDQGGFPTLVFGSRIEPSYLVLIDEQHGADHASRLADEIISELEFGNVNVERFWFDQQPDWCHTLQRGRMQRHTLAQLLNRFADHRLIIVGSSAAFFDSYTGELHRWAEELRQREDKVLLTALPVRHWSARERQLERELEFRVWALSPEGMRSLPQAFSDGAPVQKIPGDGRVRQPLFNTDVERWLESSSPSSATITLLVTDLKKELAPGVYKWLAALAFYPEIHWGITIRMGKLLFRNTTHFQLGLPELSQLIWLRRGHMPDWFRTALIQSLSPAEQAQIRQHLLTLLGSAEIGKEPSELDESAQDAARRDLLRIVRERATIARRNEPWSDQVLLEYASAANNPLSVVMPKRLLRLLFNRGLVQLGIRPTALLAVGLVCSVLLGWFLLPAATLSDVESIALSKNGSRLIVWHEDGTIVFKAVPAKQSDATAEESPRDLTRTRYAKETPPQVSNDGRVALVKKADGNYELWDLKAQKQLKLMEQQEETLATLDPDGKYVLIWGDKYSNSHVWDVANEKENAGNQTPMKPSRVEWGPQQLYLSVFDSSPIAPEIKGDVSYIEMVSAEREALIPVVRNMTFKPAGVSFSQNRELAFFWGADNAGGVYDFAAKRWIPTIDGETKTHPAVDRVKHAIIDENAGMILEWNETQARIRHRDQLNYSLPIWVPTGIKQAGFGELGAFYVFTDDGTVTFFPPVDRSIFDRDKEPPVTATFKIGAISGCNAVSTVVDNEVCIAGPEGCRVYNLNSGRPVTNPFAAGTAQRLAISRSAAGLAIAAELPNGELQLWEARRAGKLNLYLCIPIKEPSLFILPGVTQFVDSVDLAVEAMKNLPEDDIAVLGIFNSYFDVRRLKEALTAAKCRNILVITDVNLALPLLSSPLYGPTSGASPIVRFALYPQKRPQGGSEVILQRFGDALESVMGPIDGSHLADLFKTRDTKEGIEWVYTTWDDAGHNGSADIYLPLPNRNPAREPINKATAPMTKESLKK
jgi:WD40 repeat protein